MTFFVSSIAEQIEPIDDSAIEFDIDCEDDSEDDEGS